jgi:hypothetical protein
MVSPAAELRIGGSTYELRIVPGTFPPLATLRVIGHLEVFALPTDADHLVVRLDENTTLDLVGPQQELSE